MQLIIIFMIWYIGFGKSYQKKGKTREERLGSMIVAVIAVLALSAVLNMAVVLGFWLVSLMLSMGIPLMVVYTIVKKLPRVFGDRKELFDEESHKEKEYSVGRSGLVKASGKRRKLIAKFSKKYNLCLNDKEIDRINEASYVSYWWEQEVVAMSKSYDSVSEWYAGETGWLRAYLRAFSVQTVSSDFELQKNICLDSFTQIFDSVDMGSYGNIDECIEDINAKYYTLFDEAAFMIVYRFLEENGRKYKLPSVGVYKYESELDRLKQKYDRKSESEDESKRLYSRKSN